MLAKPGEWNSIPLPVLKSISYYRICIRLCIWITYFSFAQITYYSPRKYLPYASAALIAAHTVSGVTSNGIL